MFNSRMTAYNIYKPTPSTDALGYRSQGYTSAGTSYIYIVDATPISYTANDLSLLKYDAVGYTCDNSITTDYLIGDYKVVSVSPYKNERILYLIKFTGTKQ